MGLKKFHIWNLQIQTTGREDCAGLLSVMRWHLLQPRRFHNVPSTITRCRFPHSINSERLLPTHVKIVNLSSYIKSNASLIILLHPTFPPVSILSSVISLPNFHFYTKVFYHCHSRDSSFSYTFSVSNSFARPCPDFEP